MEIPLSGRFLWRGCVHFRVHFLRVPALPADFHFRGDGGAQKPFERIRCLQETGSRDEMEVARGSVCGDSCHRGVLL